jgi:hypothetical protein
MSHGIMQHDRQEGIEMGWHKLTIVRPDLSIENCWLTTWEYTPKVIPLNGKASPFSVLEVSDVPDLYVGTPYQTDSFKPVMNKRLLSILSKTIEGHDLQLASDGTIHNRSNLFLSFKLNGAKFKSADRDFQPYLNIGNGNDMSDTLWVNTSNVCTVCANTYAMNVADKGLIMSVKKTKFSETKLPDFGKAITACLNGQKQFAKQLGALAMTRCDATIARKFFAGFITLNPETGLSPRGENIVERMLVLFSHGLGNDGNDFSDVFQAMTDYYTHEAANTQDTPEAKWKNFVSSEFGSGSQRKQDAWRILTDKAKRKATVLIGEKVLRITANMKNNSAQG